MFIAALFIITKTWKQQYCLSEAEWINYSIVHPENGILINANKN